MGKDEIKEIEGVIKEYGSKVLKRVMEMTTADIKANRISFSKRTSSKDFMDIFHMSLNTYLRSCKM